MFRRNFIKHTGRVVREGCGINMTDVPTQVGFDFVCKPVGGELLAVTEETTDSRWVAKDKVLDFIEHPAIRTRYQAYLDFNGAVNYMAYLTKPEFIIKHQTIISK
ncbi:hypothetical protein MKY82_16080 [Paenibacillus sp. FSL W7-1279]|uniref:hypothetical protein n=1 Tax=Paenibacillus sp. FSL W7-1279 TaxID=2921697 RepID=UPI0030DC7B1C